MRRPRRTATILFWLAFVCASSHTPASSVIAAVAILAGLALRRSAPRQPAAPRRTTRPRRGSLAPRASHPLGLVLSPAELAGLDDARLEWRRSVLDPRPANREQVEEALRHAYEIADLAAPRITWVDSPGALLATSFPAIPAMRVLVRVAGPYHPGGTTVLPGRCALDEYMGEPWLRQTATGRAIDQAFGGAAEWNALGAVWTEARLRGRAAPAVSAESMILRVAKAEYISRWSWLDLGAWRPLVTLAREGCAYLLGKEAAYVSERHMTVATDGEGRLHSANGPAIEWADGFGVHAWHGRGLTRELFDRRHSLSIAEISGESGEERRSLLLDLFGYERLVRDGPAVVLDDASCGTLWQVALPGAEAVTLIEVVNATPEPGGERRRFFLRVPPTMRRAQEAVAWTFGLTEQQWLVTAES